MTLGFNGSNGGISSDATKIPSIMLCGNLVYSIATAVSATILIESNIGYVTFGQQAAGTAGLTKLNGNAAASSTNILSFFFSVPISGW